MTTIASIVREGDTTRLVLRKPAIEAINNCAFVLRELRAAGGEAICDHVANYLETIKKRHSPTVTIRGGAGQGRDRQLPKGDRT